MKGTVRLTWMHGAAVVAILLAGVAGWCAFFVWLKDRTPAPAAAAATPRPPTAPSPPPNPDDVWPVDSVTARELCARYQDNEVGADEWILDKRVNMTGIVGDIRTTAFGDIVIAFPCGGGWHANCYPDAKQRQVVARLKRDRVLRVRATVGGRVLASVQLKDCTIPEAQ